MGSAHWAGFSYCAWPYCSVRNIPLVRWNVSFVFQHPNPVLQMRTVRPGRLWTRMKWIRIRNTEVKVFQAYTWLHLTSTFSGTANTLAFYLKPLCVAKMMWGKKLRIYFKNIYFYEVSSYLSKAHLCGQELTVWQDSGQSLDPRTWWAVGCLCFPIQLIPLLDASQHISRLLHVLLRR